MEKNSFSHTISNCVESFTMKLLLEDILYQLGEPNTCIRLSEFINILKKNLTKKKSTTYFIIDNAHLLRSDQTNEFSLILPTFLKIASLVRFYFII